MSVVKILRQRVAPELNHLYTLPPFASPGDPDCGWFSREHALHTFFVSRLCGVPAELCRGDYAVLSRAMPPLTSLDSGFAHGWCRVEGVAPVDLSLTLAYLGEVPQLHAPIAGEGPNGEWRIRYAHDDSVLDETIAQGHEILFIERQAHAETPDALLADPYTYLPPPRIGDTTSPHARFGPDIYAKISLHCYRCTQDAATSLVARGNATQALAWIAEHYPAPEAEILRLLRG